MMKKGFRVIIVALISLALIGLACTTLMGGEGLPLSNTYEPDLPTQPVPTPETINPYWLSLEELPANGGLFDDEHCGQICAMGFRPYENTLTDFRQFIEAYPELDCQSLIYPYRYGRCFFDDWRLDLDFDPYSEVVKAVTIKVNDFTLGEFIQVHGEPTHFYMWVEEEYSQAWPIELFFPDKYVILWLNETYDFSDLSNETGYRIESDSVIHEVYILDEDEYPMEDLLWAPLWEGYGIYFTDGKATLEF